MADKPRSHKKESNGIASLVDSIKARSKWNDAHDPYVAETVPGFENANIRYRDARPLTRPFVVPESVNERMRPLLITAIVIGVLFLAGYFYFLISSSTNTATQVRENIAREVNLDLPELATLMPLDDEEILSTLQSSGSTLFEKTPIEEGSSGFEVVKLPEGVSLADAASAYATGLERINAGTAARLLNGAWKLAVTRKGGTDIYVGYADFKSHAAQAALTQALASQGIAATNIAESGVDQLGNTYNAGTVTVDDRTYNWRISVVPLDHIYDIRDLPSNAQYVGIRFTT